MNETVLLDPTAETAPEARPRIERPASLEGMTIGLLDIAKMRGDEFLDRLEELLRARGHAVRRYRKDWFANLASPEVKGSIASECQVLIEGLAD